MMQSGPRIRRNRHKKGTNEKIQHTSANNLPLFVVIQLINLEWDDLVSSPQDSGWDGLKPAQAGPWPTDTRQRLPIIFFYDSSRDEVVFNPMKPSSIYSSGPAIVSVPMPSVCELFMLLFQVNQRIYVLPPSSSFEYGPIF
jgi:hypothetical protein